MGGRCGQAKAKGGDSSEEKLCGQGIDDSYVIAGGES